MRYLKTYNENIIFESVDSMCKFYDINNYIINEDGSVDVNGSVYLHSKRLSEIPINFNRVSGDFYCYCNELESLKNCPKYVGGDFECYYNKLTSLVGIGHVGKDLNCYSNKLTSLAGCPKINGILDCNGNNIYEFGIIPDGLRPEKFYFEGNPVYNIWLLFTDFSKLELFNDYDICRGNKLVIDRLNEFLTLIDKPTVESVKGYINI